MKKITNAVRYKFSDFTHKHYRRVLATALKNYVFFSYSDFDIKKSFIILRHDVDFSVHAAYNMAKIEAGKKIKATYFFSLHSEFYNLLENKITRKAREIISMGHDVGLHFDCKYYDIKDERALVENLLREKNFMEGIFGSKINAFSFHMPDALALSFKNKTYAGLINAYCGYFWDNFGYCSDSNGFWRHQRLYDLVCKAQVKYLQILVHPEWWQSKAMSPKERVARCIDGRAAETLRWYNDALKRSERKNIGPD